MRSDQAEGRLRELVRQAGVDLEHPTHDDVERTWAVVRRFAQEPADDVPSKPGDSDDGMLALGAANLRSLDMELDAFFEQALAMPGFAGVRDSGAVPVSLDISYSDV